MDVNEAQSTGGRVEPPKHPAREISKHLLHMLETRMEAASLALQGETQRLLTRLQLRILAAAAAFIALWGGIVLLAIVLPPPLRVPVLSGVIVLLMLAAVWAWVHAARMAAARDVGSFGWLLDGLKLDLEVLSRALASSQPQSQPQPHDPAPSDQPGSPPSDIAA